MFCALLTSRYQVRVYRTNGPLVFLFVVTAAGVVPCGIPKKEHCP